MTLPAVTWCGGGQALAASHQWTVPLSRARTHWHLLNGQWVYYNKFAGNVSAWLCIYSHAWPSFTDCLPALRWPSMSYIDMKSTQPTQHWVVTLMAKCQQARDWSADVMLVTHVHHVASQIHGAPVSACLTHAYPHQTLEYYTLTAPAKLAKRAGHRGRSEWV